MKDITFKHTYTENDLIHLNTYAYFRSRSFKVMLILITILFLYFLTLSFTTNKIDWVMLILYVLLFIFVIFFNPYLIKKRVTKAYQVNQYMKVNYTYTITDLSIRQYADDYNAEYKLEDVVKIIEGDQYFYLFVNKTQSLLIPKEELKERYDDFIELLKEKISPNKLKLKK